MSSGDNVDNDSVKSNAHADRYKASVNNVLVMSHKSKCNHQSICRGLEWFSSNPQVGTHINMKNNESANLKQGFVLDKHC